jgi:hypothetical protein
LCRQHRVGHRGQLRFSIHPKDTFDYGLFVQCAGVYAYCEELHFGNANIRNAALYIGGFLEINGDVPTVINHEIHETHKISDDETIIRNDTGRWVYDKQVGSTNSIDGSIT